jgi:hypothetical protein
MYIILGTTTKLERFAAIVLREHNYNKLAIDKLSLDVYITALEPGAPGLLHTDK